MQNFFSPKISTLYSSGHRNSQYRFHLTSNGARGIVQKKKKEKTCTCSTNPLFRWREDRWQNPVSCVSGRRTDRARMNVWCIIPAFTVAFLGHDTSSGARRSVASIGT